MIHWQLNGVPGRETQCSSPTLPGLPASSGKKSKVRLLFEDEFFLSVGLPLLTAVSLAGKVVGKLDLRPGTHGFQLDCNAR